MCFFLDTFSSWGVSRCRCHQFLPSFRKEASRAGNLLAPNSSLLSSLKTGIILASSTEEQTVGSARRKSRIQMCSLLQHGMQRCPLELHFSHKTGSRQASILPIGSHFENWKTVFQTKWKPAFGGHLSSRRGSHYRA